MFDMEPSVHQDVLTCRQRHGSMNQRGGSRDRYDGVANRGSSAEGRDRYPRQGGYPHRDGSAERSDQQDRFAPRRFSKDVNRSRDLGRNRRMDHGHPSREAIRPLPVSRQPSANSTVSASRGADGRIEIAAEPSNAPSTTPLVSTEAAASAAKPQHQPMAPKPTLLPATTSPSSPLPPTAEPTASAESLPLGSLSSSSESQAAAQVVPCDGRSESAQGSALPGAELLIRRSSATTAPAAAEVFEAEQPPPPKGTNTLAMHPEQAGPAAEPTAAPAAPHLTLHPASAGTSHANGPTTPQSASHTPLAAPSLMQATQHAQHAAQQPAVTRQPHILHPEPVPNLAMANGSDVEAGTSHMPSQASAPLHQAPAFRPQAGPGPVPGGVQLPNGYPGPQQHPHALGSPANLPGARVRTLAPQHQQQQLQQQWMQQLPRRQPEKPLMQFMPGQMQHHLQNPALLPHMQGHAGPQATAESAGLAQTGPAGQGRSMHQPQLQQPGSRSSSIGQKRPMPNQEQQHVPPHQLTPPHQQRVQTSPSGPPMMGHLPFNSQMHPNGMPHYVASPNGMPPNASMPLSRAVNGMPYSVLPNQRPSMMNHVPMMSSVNMAMGKSGPMHHQGGIPYGVNPYMQSMGQMPAPMQSSAPNSQAPPGPHPAHSGPQPHPQLHLQPPPQMPPQMQSPQSLQPGPSFTPLQRTGSSTNSLPNGHIRPSPAAGPSPASSLGNAGSKASSSLRATAVPFVPGGMAQPASPVSVQPTMSASPQAQTLLQRGPRQLNSGPVLASAPPFFPASDFAGELTRLLHMYN